MKFKLLKYFPVSLIFRNQFKTSVSNQKLRNTFILRLEDGEGNMFFGEAAPLPEFGSESFEEVEDELKRLSSSKIFEYNGTLPELFEYIELLNTLPTIHFALEHVFLQNLLALDTKHIADFHEHKNINVNAVLDINDIETSKIRLKQIASEGYEVIKLKTRSENFENLLELISWSANNIEAKLKFRIDPNGSWTKNETLKRAGRLEKFPIVYLEQPVNSRNELVELAEISPIPVAADESVRNLSDAEDLINNSNLKFLIIKPMLFGGLGNVLKLKKLVEGKDIKIIISSSLESNVGRRHLALIAANVDNNLSHGLGTADLFNNQPTEDVFKIKKGKIQFSSEKYISKMKVDLE